MYLLVKMVHKLLSSEKLGTKLVGFYSKLDCGYTMNQTHPNSKLTVLASGGEERLTCKDWECAVVTWLSSGDGARCGTFFTGLLVISESVDKAVKD